MHNQKYYNNLWKTKNNKSLYFPNQRDWFHRFIIDRIFDPNTNTRHQKAQELLPGGKTLLDIGCWDGKLLELIQSSGKYTELYGIDLIPEGVQSVVEKGFQAQVVNLDRDSLPFPDQYFDAITFLAVLEHVFDPYLVIREVHRVLRPGGTLILDVPNVGSFSNRLRIFFGRLPVTSLDPGWDGGHLHYFTRHALDKFLISEGFLIQSRHTTGGGANLRKLWISLLAGDFIYRCQRL